MLHNLFINLCLATSPVSNKGVVINDGSDTLVVVVVVVVVLLHQTL